MYTAHMYLRALIALCATTCANSYVDTVGHNHYPPPPPPAPAAGCSGNHGERKPRTSPPLTQAPPSPEGTSSAD